MNNNQDSTEQLEGLGKGQAPEAGAQPSNSASASQTSFDEFLQPGRDYLREAEGAVQEQNEEEGLLGEVFPEQSPAEPRESILGNALEPDETALPSSRMPNSLDQLKTMGEMVSVVFSDTADEDEKEITTEEGFSIIAEEGEDPSREQVINKDVEEATADVIQQVNSGEQDDGILARSIQLVNQKRSERDAYTLEKKYFDKIESFKEQYPEWADLKLHQPDMTTKMREEAVKNAIISSKLDSKRIQERGVGYSFGEFLDDTGEFFLSVLGDDIGAALRTRGLDPTSLLYMGEEIRNLPADQIPSAIDNYYETLARTSSLVGTDQDFALHALENSFGTQEGVQDSQEALIMDAALTIPFVGAVKGLTSLLKGARASNKVAKSAHRTIKQGDATQTLHTSTEEAVRDAIPMSVNDLSHGTSSSVARIIELNDEALQKVWSLPGVARLTPEEVKVAVDRQVKSLEKFYHKTQINKTGVSFNESKGVHEVEIQIGRRDGAGFASRSSAKGEMKKRNIFGEIVETDSGFMISQKHAVKESMADEGFTSMPAIGAVKRLLQGPKAFVDKLTGELGTSASYVEARTIGVLKELNQNRINNLPKKDFEEVASVLNDGLVVSKKNNQWLSTEEFMAEGRRKFGKEFSDEQVAAYKTYIQLSDAAHFLDNQRIYKEKATKGLQTLELRKSKTGEFEGNVYNQVDDIPNIPSTSRTFDTSTGRASKLSADEIKKKVEEGYTLIRPDDPSWTMKEFNGEGATFVLVKDSNSVKMSPLSYNQLEYKAGGRREYSAPFFIGQLVRGTFKDGTRYLDNPNIFRTAKTRKEAEDFIKEAELARQAIRAVETGQKGAAKQAEELFEKTGTSYQDWKKMSVDERWNMDEKFRIKKDREDFPIDLEDYEAREAVRMYNPDSIDAQYGVRKNNRLSRRGDWLRDVNHEKSEVYDSMSVLTRNVDAAIKSGVFTDFKISAVNRFNTSFRKFMDNADEMSPYELATKGTISDEVRKNKPKLYNSIKAHQFYLKSILRVRGRWDEIVQGGMDSLANQIEKIPGKTAKKISTNINKNRGNPMETIRSINFDINLGMLNPQQFLMQANTALIATAMSPRYGMSSFKDVVPMRYALIADDNGTTSWLGKKVKNVTDGTDLSESVDQFRRLGFNDFGNSLALMDNQVTLGASSNRFMNKASKAKEQARFFFAEGERLSRLVAYGIAKRKYKEKFPDSNAYGKKADLWIREETDRLILSPNADNNALLNKGIGAIPTQFWSYMMKMSDAVFTGSGGRYSAAERARLAGSQVLFYGAGGMPFLDYALDSYQKSTGEVMDPTTAKFLHNGMIDLIPFVASGGEIDTDFSSASGMGRWMSSILENVTENNMPELLGGPAGSKMHGAWKVAQNTARITGMIREPDPKNISITAATTVASLVKSLSASTQAAIAYNTGIWYDRYGRQVADVSKGEAIMSMFSFGPQAQTDAWKILTDQKKNQQKYVSEVIPQFEHLHIMYNNAETEEERQHYEESINALASLVQGTGYLGDVSQGLLSYMRSPNFLESLQRKLTRSYNLGQEGVNPNLLPLEQKRKIIELQDE